MVNQLLDNATSQTMCISSHTRIHCFRPTEINARKAVNIAQPAHNDG